MSEVQFVEINPEKVTKDLVEIYENAAGKKLHPAQSERLMIDLVAYITNLQDIKINEAAKQNLAAFASYPMLDEIGKLVGETRLPAQKSKTTIQTSLNEAKEYSVFIPAKTQIESKDKKVIFETINSMTINAGELSAETDAECQSAGIIGNGYLQGEINAPIESLDIDAIENITTTAGGADLEDDEPYRQRIFEAPEKFTVAGSKGSYKALVKSAHQNIIDVAVVKPRASATLKYQIGEIEYAAQIIENNDYSANFTCEHIENAIIDYRTGEASVEFNQAVESVDINIPPTDILEIYPLTKDGNPDNVIIEAVEVALNTEDKIPMTDNRIIKSPENVDFEIDATITILQGYNQSEIEEKITAKLSEYIEKVKQSLGKDIVPAQISALILSVEGVYNVVLDSPTYQTLKEYQWANGSILPLSFEVHNG